MLFSNCIIQLVYGKHVLFFFPTRLQFAQNTKKAIDADFSKIGQKFEPHKNLMESNYFEQLIADRVK